jgi:hypothetical protein
MRNTIEFASVDEFLDRLRVDRRQIAGPVKLTVDIWNRRGARDSEQVSRLTGALLEFEVVAEACTNDTTLELRCPCGEFQQNVDRPPPMSAESDAAIKRIVGTCEELELAVVKMN